ncbi:ceramide-1-phosphate transfer protein-like [Notechis scutatus]|uniref:Ceramide-1-phosphate transfer protein-like n=1 Tax=Notechis scutatus TaxID=8663 RepID=A0A6J1WA33_9SAUR|nr:ceramide-1-phosphate transfer protein-like [Notechis scutatus]
MGAPSHPSQLLLLLGVFLLVLLLHLSSWSLRQPGVGRGGELRGVQSAQPAARLPCTLAPCAWEGHRPKEGEGEEQPSPAPAPAGTPTAPLPLWGEEDFDIRQLQRAFSASLSPQGEILLGEYLHGWGQLLKLTDALGPAFGLISREAQSKISIMQWHQQGPQGPHYRTVQSMVDFELTSGLVGFRSLPARLPPSGCRTLLRLHRTLKWLELFLRRLGASREDESPSRMCAEAYRLALAPYHSWWVRQGAALAFLALPSRRELYHTILRVEQLAAGALVLTTVESLGRVYNVTQEVYSAHGMLDLP